MFKEVSKLSTIILRELVENMFDDKKKKLLKDTNSYETVFLGIAVQAVVLRLNNIQM